jgi:hypothetical protein
VNVPDCRRRSAPCDEGLQDDVAQVGAAVQELVERLGGYLVDFALAARDRIHQRWAASEMRHVAGELARPVDPDRLR